MKLFDSGATVLVTGQPAGWTSEGAIRPDEPPTYPQVESATVGGSVTFTWTSYTPPPEVLSLDLAGAPSPLYAITTYGTRPRRLLTGPLGSKRRVDHARELRMASWLRRRERRRGIPAVPPLHTWLHFPHARMELS